MPFAPARAQSLHQGEVLRITRAVSPVRVDGALDDEAWKAVQPVQQWYEFNPGDNVAPKVESVGYLSYDDRFLYAGFEFSVGYGDDRELSHEHELEKPGRQFFTKVSYAFQR
jgi:hypothetical protein